MSRVLVLDQQRRPLMPCTPARARLLLKQKKAAVWRRYPFTLILRVARPDAIAQPLRLKIDPGSRTSGLAVTNDTTGEVVWAAELTHRGEQVHTPPETGSRAPGEAPTAYAIPQVAFSQSPTAQGLASPVAYQSRA